MGLLKTERVVVTAAGSVVGQGIIKCLKLANAQGHDSAYRIFATDASPMAAGLYRGDSGYLVPAANDRNYLDAMIDVCKKAGADAMFVGSDEELMPLARSKKRFESASGAKVIVNPVKVLETCSDKWMTHVFLKEQGLPTAESSVPESASAFLSKAGFPVVVKPRQGHGSEEVHVAHDQDEVDLAVERIEKGGRRALIQEYLEDDGNEYTTGVTVSESGAKVMSCIAMRRTLKGGQTYKAFIDDFDEVRESARAVALEIGARGPLNIQSRLVEGEPKIFEINARLSASCPMRAVAGVNEPDILYRNFVHGVESDVMEYQKLVSMRFWNEVYVRRSTFDRTKKEKKFAGPDSVVLQYF